MLYVFMINEYLLVVKDKNKDDSEIHFYVPEAFDYLSDIVGDKILVQKTAIEIAQILNNAQNIQCEHIGEYNITSDQLNQTSEEIKKLEQDFLGYENHHYNFSVYNSSRLGME